MSATTSDVSTGTRSRLPVRPVWTGRARLFWTWVLAVTAGELLGFAVPALTGAITEELDRPAIWLVLVMAGTAEGAILGSAQAWVFRGVLPELSAGRWVVATSISAGFAWLLGLTPSMSRSTWSPWLVPVVVAAALVGSALLLLCIGVAQWTQLRRHVPRAGGWILGTAAGWCLGLSVFFAVTSPLWQPDQGPATVAAIAAMGGIAMAAAMAVITGLVLVRLLDRGQHSVGALSRELLLNPLVEALLHSRWHPILSGSTAVLTYTGTRTGRRHSLAVVYARIDDELILVAGHHHRKRWWRNFRRTAEVEVVLRGESRSATARRVLLFDRDYEQALRLYRERFPRARVGIGSPVIHLHLHGALDEQQLGADGLLDEV